MMTLKTLSFGCAIAVLTSLLTVFLVRMTLPEAQAAEKTPHIESSAAPETSWQKVKAFFASDKAKPVIFVEINNIVINLKSDGSRDRYMLLELAFIHHDDAASKVTESLIPAIRGTTVALLSDKEYDEVRQLSVPQLHDQLMAAYRQRFKELNTPLPFSDVIISKMLLQ
jgi:flagellar FliL protein